MWQIFKLNSQLIISLALQAIEAELSWAASSEKSSTSRIWFKTHTIDDKWAQLVSRHLPSPASCDVKLCENYDLTNVITTPGLELNLGRV